MDFFDMRLIRIASVCAVLLLFPTLICSAQGWSAEFNASVRGAYGTGDYMPFWARTGEEGTLPVTSSGLLRAGARLGYHAANGLFFEAEEIGRAHV